MINAHERNDRQFAEAAANDAIAMAARTAPDTYSSAAARGQSPVRSRSPVTEQRRDRGGDRDRGAGGSSRSLQDVQCYRCGKYGHVQRNCQKPRTAATNGHGSVAGSGYGSGRRDENVSSVLEKKSAQVAFAVIQKTMRVRRHGQVTMTDKHGWTRIEKKSGAWRKMESKEAPPRGRNPAVGSGEWRQKETSVSSAIPVRGNQRVHGPPSTTRPGAALKKGILCGASSSSVGASTPATMTATSAAASPATSDSQSRVKVLPKSCLKVPGTAKEKAASAADRHVYWNMALGTEPEHSVIMTVGKSTSGLSDGVAEAAESAMTEQQPREMGVDSMASISINGNKALFKGGLRPCRPFTVVMADMGEQVITQVGSVELHIDVGPGQTVSYVIDNVYYHPRFSGSNLLSLDGLTQNGWKFFSEKAETYLLTPDGLKVLLNTDRRVSILRCFTKSCRQSERATQPASEQVYSLGKVQWDSAEDLVLLHSRLGHVGFDRMVNIIKSQHTEGIGRLNMSAAVLKEARGRVLECKACKEGKGTRTAFGHRGLDKGSAPGEALHMDTYYMKYDRADGTPSIEYGLTLSCPHTTARFTTRVSSKDQMPQAVIGIIRQVQTQMGCNVKRLYADGGSEFINQTIKNFCTQQGIRLHHPPAGTPELNSVAERQVRSSKDAGRTLLMHAGLPARFGPRAIEHATYVWNRTNVAPATGRTPYEVLMKKKPSIQHIGVFGCDAYYHVARNRRGTFDAKMLPGIYLGHSFERGCFIVYDLNSGQEVYTRDVECLDRRFTHAAALVAGGEQLEAALSADRPRKVKVGRKGPRPESDLYDVERILAKRIRNGITEYHVKWCDYDESEATWEPAEHVEAGASEAIYDFEEEQRQAQEDPDPVIAEPAARDLEDPSAAVVGSEESEAPSEVISLPGPAAADAVAPAAAPAVAAAPDVNVASAPAASRRRSPRDHASSASVDAGQQHVQMAMSVISSSLPGGDLRLDNADTQLVCAVATGLAQLETKTPATWREAMKSEDAPHWRAAADKEMTGCEQMGVWELVSRSSVPKWQTIIGCKWVFKIKTDSSGAVDVYKARITPKGFLQKFGTNFFETFAATGKYKSLRLGLSITAACEHNLEQMDVPQAFLNADVDEEVYMELPEGYREGREHLVCLLKKALYGLKQAPRNWYLLISKFVQEELGYKSTVSDPCLFFKRSHSGRLMLLFLFVDDFQSSYHPEDKAEWDELKGKLIVRFKTKDLGPSTWILGMRITRDLKARTITLDQELYLTKALERHGMQQCKPVSTPGVPGGNSTVADGEDNAAGSAVVDRQLYMEMVGTVMYPAISCRPDIAHAAQKLAQAMQNPTPEDMQAAKRVFRYLAGTKDIGLVFGSRSDKVLDTRGRNNFRLDVCAFADADWANDKADRKSITGWVAKVNGDPISWASKKQRTVAQSTCEAELYAEAAAIQEVLWLRGLLHELGLHVQTGSLVYGDNQSTLAISKNGIKGERTKHVDVKYHFITETVESGKVELKWIPTQEQQADIFTKALAAPVFEHFRKMLMTR